MFINNRKAILPSLGRYCYGVWHLPEDDISQTLQQKVKYNFDNYELVPSEQFIGVLYKNRPLFLSNNVNVKGISVYNIVPNILPKNNEILVRFLDKNIIFVAELQMIVKRAEIVDRVKEIEYVLDKYPEHCKIFSDNYDSISHSLTV